MTAQLTYAIKYCLANYPTEKVITETFRLFADLVNEFNTLEEVREFESLLIDELCKNIYRPTNNTSLN